MTSISWGVTTRLVFGSVVGVALTGAAASCVESSEEEEARVGTVSSPASLADDTAGETNALAPGEISSVSDLEAAPSDLASMLSRAAPGDYSKVGEAPDDYSSYRETKDSGDDPFVAGCLAVYEDEKCDDLKFVLGDECSGGTGIIEQTPTQDCHVPADAEEGSATGHDCDQLCKDLFAISGACVTVPELCHDDVLGDLGHEDSAVCVCKYAEDPKPEIFHTNTGDNGNDPGVAGCHWSWSEGSDSDSPTWVGGDRCVKGDRIAEWVEDDWHAAEKGERVKISCTEWCQSQPETADHEGVCVRDKNYCGRRQHSAHCECRDSAGSSKPRRTWRFMELKDSGEDPFTPGCAASFKDDPKCEGDWTLYYVDHCMDETTLDEGLQPQSCTRKFKDTVEIDCDALCRKTDGTPGKCVSAPQFCERNLGTDGLGPADSAKCVCEDEQDDLFHTNTKDKGSDPGTAGCHWSWEDAKCGGERMWLAGDGCGDNPQTLWEWEEDDCHPADKAAKLDCSEWCIEQQGEGHYGVCIPDVAYCGAGKDSAHCECRVSI